ncbi:MAG: indolepyruvate ferredoxin oxidoreductase family protein [Candidatus Latescibacteria bacterium]|nr:indolepyruvate ferredoxin oxidoreductase family protein [Candidatus Latescibacterota bacterium]
MNNQNSELFSLRDRYQVENGTVFITGVQAIVRFLIEKQRNDVRSGSQVRRTFISGYEGSPLGGLDLEIIRNLDLLNMHSHSVHQPAVNEKIAAAAVTGSQYNGDVDGFWYGKAHGTKWAADELSLANLSGSGETSGVVLFCGDDHAAKSSGYPAGSENVLRDVKAAVFYPSSILEVIDYAHHALALSRHSGLVCALKMVTPICDGAATVSVTTNRSGFVLPRGPQDESPFNKVFQPVVIATGSLPYEEELAEVRLELAREYGRLNQINRIMNAGSRCTLGIVASGKSSTDVDMALEALGIAGQIKILKLGLIFPLDHNIVKEFAQNLDTVVVVEEKGPFVEEPVAQALLNTGVDRLFGKRGPEGSRLIPAHGELDPDQLTTILAPLLRSHFPSGTLSGRVEEIERLSSKRNLKLFPSRAAHYCPGCPHSISVKAPNGELAGGEIGCSSIDAYVKAEGRGVRYIPTMGLGGAINNGMFPFNENEHMFQNVGDGTVLHSGLMTIFSSISHGANVTYKILWNHVVAMTGGQDITGRPGIDEFVLILLGLGVGEVAVVSKYPDRVHLDRSKAARNDHQRLDVWGRDDFEEVQTNLKDKKGVNVLLYDQECATEARRRRKRQGTDIPEYIMINEEVCEGCGDCGEKSMCLALRPKETIFGTKTSVLQSSCSQDTSCLKGDCPSFMTITPAGGGTRLRRPETPSLQAAEIEEPASKREVNGNYAIHIIGIGGTGVVTTAHLLGFAAMFEGKFVNELNRTGLAQKGGPVESPVIIGETEAPPSNTISTGTCDLYLAADIVGATNPVNLVVTSEDRTVAVVSRSNIPTAEMVYNPLKPLADVFQMQKTINDLSREDHNVFIDAQFYAEALFGDHIVTNIFLLGVAYQAGQVPLQAVNIEKAIQLNGQAVEMNLQAFRWGRLAISNPDRLDEAAHLTSPVAGTASDLRQQFLEKSDEASASFFNDAMMQIPIEEEEFQQLWAVRVGDLIAYQNVAYARQYVTLVKRVYGVDLAVGGDSHRYRLTYWVAFVLYKLMAYKDEYEVARLLTGTKENEIRKAFDGRVKLSYNLHPPFLRHRGMNSKIQFGPWFRPVLRILSRLKFLRHSRFDPFGRSIARREERETISWFEQLIANTMPLVTPETYPDIVDMLRIPEKIRGYEDIKRKSIAEVKTRVEQTLGRIQETVAIKSDESVHK